MCRGERVEFNIGLGLESDHATESVVSEITI